MEITKLASAYERLHNDYQYLLWQYECLQNELMQIDELKEQIRYWEDLYHRQVGLHGAFLETHNALQARYLRIEARNDAFEYALRQKSALGKYLALKDIQNGKLKQEAK